MRVEVQVSTSVRMAAPTGDLERGKRRGEEG
jgi:hypothetical protein